jgi:hypothetical protein
MPETDLIRQLYVDQVLLFYRQTPGTTGKVNSGDRMLAAQLQQRGVPLSVVENALVLAAARRTFRPPEAPPLATVRSLAYFVPVIEELLHTQVSQEYFQHLRRKLQSFYSRPR